MLTCVHVRTHMRVVCICAHVCSHVCSVCVHACADMCALCARACMCVHVCVCVCVCTCVCVPLEGSALCVDTRGLSEMTSPTAPPAQTLVPRPPGSQGQRREARDVASSLIRVFIFRSITNVNEAPTTPLSRMDRAGEALPIQSPRKGIHEDDRFCLSPPAQPSPLLKTAGPAHDHFATAAAVCPPA